MSFHLNYHLLFSPDVSSQMYIGNVQGVLAYRDLDYRNPRNNGFIKNFKYFDYRDIY